MAGRETHGDLCVLRLSLGLAPSLQLSGFRVLPTYDILVIEPCCWSFSFHRSSDVRPVNTSPGPSIKCVRHNEWTIEDDLTSEGTR
jgi:hypothetical protein